LYDFFELKALKMTEEKRVTLLGPIVITYWMNLKVTDADYHASCCAVALKTSLKSMLKNVF
jgi:hypothetical protein